MICLFRFARDKVNFSISSDDPVLTGGSVMKDMHFAKDLGLTDEDLIAAVCAFHYYF